MKSYFLIFVSISMLFSKSGIADTVCGSETNTALQKQGVDTKIAKTMQVNSEEYKTKRDEITHEANILANHLDSQGLSDEAKKLVIDFGVQNMLGEKYVTKEQYKLLKSLGYYDIPVEKSAPDGTKKPTIKDKIAKFFKSFVTEAKKAYEFVANKVREKVLDEYSPPPAAVKLVSDLKEFRKKYDIHQGDGFDLLISDDTKFDNIVYGKNDGFREYLMQNKVQAYEIRQDKNHPVLVQYEAGSCALKRVVFIDKNQGNDWASTSYSYFTPNYCSDLPQLDSLKEKFATGDDASQIKVKCKEQGADDNCRCSGPKAGNYINPWGDTCFSVRKRPVLTASDKFEQFAESRGALPAYFYTRDAYEESVSRCKTVSALESEADHQGKSGGGKSTLP